MSAANAILMLAIRQSMINNSTAVAITMMKKFDDGHEYDRTVVITAETEPNFESGAAAWTPDEGRTWFQLPEVSGYWAVAFANPRAGWFVGNGGQILNIRF